MPQSGLSNMAGWPIYLYSPSRILQGLRFSSGLPVSIPPGSPQSGKGLVGPSGRKQRAHRQLWGSCQDRFGRGPWEGASPASDPQKALADSVLLR